MRNQFEAYVSFALRYTVGALNLREYLNRKLALIVVRATDERGTSMQCRLRYGHILGFFYFLKFPTFLKLRRR